LAMSSSQHPRIFYFVSGASWAGETAID